MVNFQGKKNYREGNKNFRRIFESWPALGLLCLILFVFIWNMFGFFGKMLDTGKNKRIAESKLNDLKNDKLELESRIASLNTDKGIEEKIREDYALGKEGEGLVQIVEEKKAKDSESEVKNSGLFSIFSGWFK